MKKFKVCQQSTYNAKYLKKNLLTNLRTCTYVIHFISFFGGGGLFKFKKPTFNK